MTVKTSTIFHPKQKKNVHYSITRGLFYKTKGDSRRSHAAKKEGKK